MTSGQTIEPLHADAAGVSVDGYALSMRAGYLLRRSHRLHLQIWNHAAPAGITSPQAAVLSAVEEYPGMDQTALGARTYLDKASVTDVVRRLVDRGDLLRSVSPFDSRRKVLSLSRDAKRRMPAVRAASTRVWDEVFAPIPDADRDTFVSQISSLVDFDPDSGRDAGMLFRRLEQKRVATWSRIVGDSITGPQYAVVHVIGQWPGSSQTELAELAALDKSTIAGIVDRLIAKGWMLREPDPVDRRARRLFLTDSALAMVDEFTPRFNEVQSHLLNPVPARLQPRFMRKWALVAYRGHVPPASATS